MLITENVVGFGTAKFENVALNVLNIAMKSTALLKMVSKMEATESIICPFRIIKLFEPSKCDFKHAFHRFATVCVRGGMKISGRTNNVLHLLRKPYQIDLDVFGQTLMRMEKFKYSVVSGCL